MASAAFVGGLTPWIAGVLGLVAGLLIGLKLGRRRRASAPAVEAGASAHGAPPSLPAATTLVLDTSVVIDGRILALLEAWRDERRILVPDVTSGEIAQLARSRDEDRRRRGERGQRVLEELARRAGVVVEPPARMGQPGGADAELVRRIAAGAGELVLVTLDAPLVAVLRAQSLAVIDLAHLSARLVAPQAIGDVIEVLVAARGRHPGQGTGTLDDGTRVIVEEGAALVGTRVHARITKLARTRGGRVLFARVESPGENR